MSSRWDLPQPNHDPWKCKLWFVFTVIYCRENLCLATIQKSHRTEGMTIAVGSSTATVHGVGSLPTSAALTGFRFVIQSSWVIVILHHTTGWWPIVFWTITMARTQYLHPLKIHICIPTTYGLGNKMQISRQTSQWYAMAFFGTYPKNPQGPSNGRLWTCIAGVYRSSK